MSQTPTQERRILVADDDHAIRQLVTTIMKREHLPVDAVADGAEAIEKLREHDYAVVLVDLMMPRVDGFGVIDYIGRNMPALKPVVLVVTAYADQKFKEVDPNVVAGVLRKPFEVADLGALVRLCAHGYNEELANRLSRSNDPDVRRFVSTGDLPGGDMSGNVM